MPLEETVEALPTVSGHICSGMRSMPREVHTDIAENAGLR
jgi:hypothetical protein